MLSLIQKILQEDSRCPGIQLTTFPIGLLLTKALGFLLKLACILGGKGFIYTKDGKLELLFEYPNKILYALYRFP